MSDLLVYLVCFFPYGERSKVSHSFFFFSVAIQCLSSMILHFVIFYVYKL